MRLGRMTAHTTALILGCAALRLRVHSRHRGPFSVQQNRTLQGGTRLQCRARALVPHHEEERDLGKQEPGRVGQHVEDVGAAAGNE